MFNFFNLGILFLILGAFISLFTPKSKKLLIFAIFSVLGNISFSIVSLKVLLFSGETTFNVYLSFPIGKVNFVVDYLSAFFMLIISLVTSLGIIYGTGYLKKYLSTHSVTSHLIFINILILAMIMVTTVQNSLFFLIVWELMSVSSFFLVIFENDKEEVLKAGINYLITMHIGFVFLLIGFTTLIIQTNSLNFEDFKVYLSNNNNSLIFLILFIGFSFKAGLIPFHSWLPKAHPVAPSHISGIMSAVMIKTGIYGILRIITLTDNISIYIGVSILILALITAFLGVIYSMLQSDYKKLLAYSSIENIGIITIGIAIGIIGKYYSNELVSTLGFLGAIFHVFNHSIFKSLMFFASGNIYQQTHTKNIEKLGGLMKKMPHTGIVYLIGSLSICGLPLFSGFVSKFIIYFGLLNNIQAPFIKISVISIITFALLGFVGAIAIIGFTKLFSIIFSGVPRTNIEDVKESDKIMLIPLYILAGLSVLIGIFPQYVYILLHKTVFPFFNNITFMSEDILFILTKLSNSMLIFVGIIGFISLIRHFLLKNKKITKESTWGCGYNAPNTRMQYTGYAYVSSFAYLVKPISGFFTSKKSPKGLFPKESNFKFGHYDIFDKYLSFVLNFISYLFSFFGFVQKGKIQTYILYGLIFLIMLLTWTIIKG